MKPLPCGCWTCDYCAPRRRLSLIRLAAEGEPNKILTLTVNPAVGIDALDRRNMLHDAWKRLVKRILRQFALPPAERWRLKSRDRDAKMTRRLARAAKQTPHADTKQLHYMAFLEKTKAGEPHLHILLRCPMIPQDWISEQMLDMMNAPVCWIEAINSTRHAVHYVTKYVTKAPAQFGTGKRYWVSRHYQIANPDAPKRERIDMRDIHIQRERWDDFLRGAFTTVACFEALDDGWIRVWRRWGYHDKERNFHAYQAA